MSATAASLMLLTALGEGNGFGSLAIEKFTQRFSDLSVWMHRPTLDDVSRTDAWPFISWCFATGLCPPRRSSPRNSFKRRSFHHLGWTSRPPKLIGQSGRNRSSMGHDVDPSGLRFQALAFMSMTTGETIDTFTDQSFDSISEEVRPHHTSRRVIAKNSTADYMLYAKCVSSWAHLIVPREPQHPRFTALIHTKNDPATRNPGTAQRYLRRVATTLRPSTIEDRCENLELFAMWLQRPAPEDHRDRSTRPGR